MDIQALLDLAHEHGLYDAADFLSAVQVEKASPK